MRRSRAFGEVLDVMAEVKRRGNRGFRERERGREGYVVYLTRCAGGLNAIITLLSFMCFCHVA